MSDPYDTAPAGTRFLMCGYDAHPKEFASGDWVRYSDYARLKAEVERLKINDYKNLSMRIEIDKLNAKINRLVKAGDKMVLCIDGDYNYQMPCVQAWNAAKDGKTSE